MSRGEHGYVRYTAGCRCVACRAAKADYMRDKRARAAEAREAAKAAGQVYVAPGITHGTTSGYRDAKCRCPDCRGLWNATAIRWQGGDAAVRRRCETVARETALEAVSLGHSAGFATLYAAALRDELALAGGAQ